MNEIQRLKDELVTACARQVLASTPPQPVADAESLARASAISVDDILTRALELARSERGG